MATGLIGTIASAGTLVYTAPNAAKMLIAASNAATPSVSVSVNGTSIISLPIAWTSGSASLYVGAGQTITIVNATGITAVVSVLEEY